MYLKPFFGSVMAVVLVGMLASPSFGASVIDFENFADGDALGIVTLSDNAVRFSVGGASPTGLAYVAQVGPPTTAFVPNDTPALASLGSYVLTDEPSGPSLALNYFMDFLNPVTGLSLNLIDFRSDGGAGVGHTATLNVYSDLGRTNLVGQSVFTITSGLVDGNVETLGVVNPKGGAIRSAALIFSTGDVGTGIDNIRFVTVPLPSAAWAGMVMLGALAGVRKARAMRSA